VLEPDRYLQGIQRAIDYIEDNLGRVIDGSQVAACAGFSTYHFQRVFSAMLGESVAEYIRKRRLSEAARALKQTTEPILEIALRCGFDSQEAFTRAFKKMFRVTPGRYRAGPVPFVIKPRATPGMLAHLRGGITMEPKIVSRDKELAVGMGGGFAPKSTNEIGELWGQFVKRMSEIESAKHDYSLGICCPAHPQIEMRNSDCFVYIAAVPVEAAGTVPQGMVQVEIPGGRYAVFTHKGPISELAHTIDFIWGTWIPKSEYEKREGPDFELYDERFDPETLAGEIDIYVPVA